MRGMIYYFSGTGNSYYIAQSLATGLNMEFCKLKYIQSTIKNYELIGIVVPVYATHAPEAVLKYINDSQFMLARQIFVVITYAGSYGFASREINLAIIKNKDCLIQNYKIKMPGNSILEYGAFPHVLQKVLLNNVNKRIEKITTEIVNKKSTNSIKPNLLARLFYKNGLKMIKEFNEIGTKFYVNNQCNKCKICQKICPVENIEWINNKPSWGEKCQQCMACVQWCNYNAICHPKLPDKRKRYHHPCVTVKNLIMEDINEDK